MQRTMGDRLVKRFAGSKQLGLTDVLRQRARPHAIGKRLPVLYARRGHSSSQRTQWRRPTSASSSPAPVP